MPSTSRQEGFVSDSQSQIKVGVYKVQVDHIVKLARKLYRPY